MDIKYAGIIRFENTFLDLDLDLAPKTFGECQCANQGVSDTCYAFTSAGDLKGFQPLICTHM